MTGWGSGYCGGASYPRGFSRGTFGGRQGGFGRGGGWRHRYWATGRPRWSRPVDWGELGWSADDERRALEREAETLEAELRHLRARIEELESPNSD